jgi:hypothetical protein
MTTRETPLAEPVDCSYLLRMGGGGTYLKANEVVSHYYESLSQVSIPVNRRGRGDDDDDDNEEGGVGPGMVDESGHKRRRKV